MQSSSPNDGVEIGCDKGNQMVLYSSVIVPKEYTSIFWGNYNICMIWKVMSRYMHGTISCIYIEFEKK